MRLFSYVVARDYGFAPNPFFGFCTLATCKPRIRKAASVGDWVMGTGSKKQSRQGYIVFIMRITETMTFNEYWEDARFHCKKPNLFGSMKQAFGDNIYYKKLNGKWVQLNSHHSYPNGVPNPHNIANDTQVDRVLISTEYAYWGKMGPSIHKKFRNYNNFDICCPARNHKSNFPKKLVKDFAAWFCTLNKKGYLGEPLEWSSTP